VKISCFICTCRFCYFMNHDGSKFIVIHVTRRYTRQVPPLFSCNWQLNNIWRWAR
jgi:hypothetical protein